MARFSACLEIVRLRRLLLELGIHQSQSTPLHVDNISAIKITENKVFHGRTKRIEINCHYTYEAHDDKIITLSYVSIDL